MTLDHYGHLSADQLAEVAERLDTATRVARAPDADIVPITTGLK